MSFSTVPLFNSPSRRPRYRLLSLAILTLVLPALTARTANADTIPVGFVSWDVTIPGITGQFDVANETGPNSSGDAFFPIISPANLGDLLLTVQFSDNSTRQFVMSDFVLNPFDGLSFESPSLAIGGFNPLPVSASLTGQILSNSLLLYDGSTFAAEPAFSSVITGSGATLKDGDLALINATGMGTPPVAATPEPPTWILLCTGLMLFATFRRTRSSRC